MFASWHAAHEAARAVLALSPSLPAHAALEAYSVLTRLPPAQRATATDVRAFLEREFPGPHLVLDASATSGLVAELADHDITGGATYDGLIAVTARTAGATLYTCDRRARRVYERLGVEIRFVG